MANVYYNTMCGMTYYIGNIIDDIDNIIQWYYSVYY